MAKFGQYDPDDGVSLPTIMTSTNFNEACLPRPTPAELWIKPFLEKGTPFLGWTPLEIRDFFVGNCPSPPENPDLWPLASFGILDSLSVLDPDAPTHRTILLCSFMPDWLEGAAVWLKTCRVKFEMFPTEVCRLEVFVTRPSELGKEMAVSFAIPLITVGRQGTREQVSYGPSNDHRYSEEHMAMQGGDKGCVRYFVRPSPPGDLMGKYGKTEEGKEMEQRENKEQHDATKART